MVRYFPGPSFSTPLFGPPFSGPAFSGDPTRQYDVCHLWPVQERSPLPVHKPGINSLYHFVTRTVSQLANVISKVYCLQRRTVLLTINRF